MGTDGTERAAGPWPNGGARVLAGRYRLETPIGRGGMGVVWRATDQLLDRQVAVKELSPDEDAVPGDDEVGRRRERTLREARALAQLTHPHIIGVYDVVAADDRPCIVMELVDGPTLAELIQQNGPVDCREAARIGIALLTALRRAHAAGVLHRDLKPANVLLERDTGRVVLTDFGVARITGATTLTESGSFLGSPEYTAPERMAGVSSGPQSDLWSLGVLLCAAVSGRSPFRRESLSAVLVAVVSDEIRVPEEAGPLASVIRGLLERDPEHRLDAEQAEWMLRGYVQTGRVPALPPGAGPPGAERPRRAPLAGRLSQLPLPRWRRLPATAEGEPPVTPPRTPRMSRRPYRSARRGVPRTRTAAPRTDEGRPGEPGGAGTPGHGAAAGGSAEPPEPRSAARARPARYTVEAPPEDASGAPDGGDTGGGPVGGSRSAPTGGPGAGGRGAPRGRGEPQLRAAAAPRPAPPASERADHTFAAQDRPAEPSDHTAPPPDHTPQRTTPPVGRPPASKDPETTPRPAGPVPRPPHRPRSRPVAGAGGHSPAGAGLYPAPGTRPVPRPPAGTGPWPPADAEQWSPVAPDAVRRAPRRPRSPREAGRHPRTGPSPRAGRPDDGDDQGGSPAPGDPSDGAGRRPGPHRGPGRVLGTVLVTVALLAAVGVVALALVFLMQRA